LVQEAEEEFRRNRSRLNKISAAPLHTVRTRRGCITINSGLLVSQVLTLYTTPVVYLLLDKLHGKLGGIRKTYTALGLRIPEPVE
jgi:hypothetical protein